MAVKLLKTLYANATVYNPGEVAGFALDYEQQLIREGAAVPHDADAPGAPLKPARRG